MKKTFRLLGLAVVAVLMAVGMAACGDDDEGEPADPATHDPALVGTWVERYEFGEGDYEEDTLTFHRDGTLDGYYVCVEEGEKESYSYHGLWHTSGNRLTIVDPDADEDYTGVYSLNYEGDQLRFDGVTYHKQ